MLVRDKLCKGLEAAGWTRVDPSKSRKYIQYARNTYMWVGKNGALRYGKTVSGSVSISPASRLYQEILAAGEATQKQKA